MVDWMGQGDDGMSSGVEVLQVIDHLIVASRIRDLSHYALGERGNRVERLAAILSQLTSGWYLIGVGPHFSDIIRIGASPVTLGRPASLREEPIDQVIDYAVNDATLLGPREVSRLHLSVRQRADGEALEVRDEHSTTGTHSHTLGERLAAGKWCALESGHIFSLGPDGVNMFVVARAGDA